jgi:DHA1 family multidrug resistance protein-like MFS transporter
MRASATPERVGIRVILSDRAVVTVIGLAFVLMVGTGLVLPVLPLYARSFGGGYGDAGVLVSAYAFARLAADLVGGMAIDRFGERLAAGSGLVLMSLSGLATGLAPSFALAVAFWAGAGIGSALVFAGMYSQLLRIVPEERMARTLSVFYGAFNVGVIVGGVVGGVVAHGLGLAAPLFVFAGASFVSATLYLRFLPRRRGGAAEDPPLTAQEAIVEREIAVPRHARGRIARVLRTPGFVMVIVANFAYVWIVVTIFDTLVPLFARDELGMSTVAIGAVFAVAIATEFVVLYPAGSLTDRKGRRYVLVPSLVALAAMTAVLGFSWTPVVLGAGMALLGVASGFAGVPPGAMLADVIPKEASGTAVGIFRFASDLGFTLGPLVAGFTASGLGFRSAFAVSAIPAVLALVLVARGPETLGRGAGTPGREY